MKSTTRAISAALVLGLFLLIPRIGSNAAAPPVLPNPVLYMTSSEAYQVGGKTFIRYQYDVLNKADYPAAMFAAAPALPPCGTNTKSSRTWS